MAGQIKWKVDFDGLDFETTAIKIDELGGQPFINAGSTHISLALLPLLGGQVCPSHIEFQDPEFWAIRLAKGKWNFSDLQNFEGLRNITYVVCKNGLVHIRDASTEGNGLSPVKALSVDLTKIQFKLDRSFGKIFWPYALSVSIPQARYTTRVSVSGTGSGDLSQWRQKNCSIDAKIDDFDPSSLSVLGFSPPAITAPVELKIKASGIPSKELIASLLFQNPRLRLSVDKLHTKGDLVEQIFLINTDEQFSTLAGSHSKIRKLENTQAHSALNTDGAIKGNGCSIDWRGAKISVAGSDFALNDLSGRLKLDKDSIAGDQIKGKIGAGTFTLKGALNDKGDFNAVLGVQAVDLGTVQQCLTQLNLMTDLPAAHLLSGVVQSAQANVTREKQKISLAVNIQPAGICLRPKGQARLLQLTGGQIHFNGQNYLVSDLEGRLKGGSFVVRGLISTDQDRPVNMIASGTKIDLEAVRSLADSLSIHLPKTAADRLSGQLSSAKLKVSGTLRRPAMFLDSQVGNIYIQDKAKTRVFQLTGGNLKIDKDMVTLNNVQGNIGKGQFALSGNAVMTKRPVLNVRLTARDIDLSNAKLVLTDLGVKSPLLAEQLLFGTVKKIDMRISGGIEAPAITLDVIPDDISFEPFGSDKPMHIQSGHVSYDHDSLKMENVQISTPRSDLRASLTIDTLSKDSRIRKLIVHSRGMGLKDLHSYLAADRTPSMVREPYLTFLRQNAIESPYGKVAGYLHYQADQSGHSVAKGKLQLHSLSVSLAAMPIHGVNGLLSIDNDILTVSNVQGYVSKSGFGAEGLVRNVGDSGRRSYQLDLTSNLEANDLCQLLNSNCQVSAQNAKTLVLKGTLAQKTLESSIFLARLTKHRHFL